MSQSILTPLIILCQPEPDELTAWVADIHRVKDAGPELLEVMREIVKEYRLGRITNETYIRAFNLTINLPDIKK